RVWDVASKQAFTFKSRQKFNVGTLTFSPDGRLIVTHTDNKVLLLDAATGSERGILEGNAAGLVSVKYSADGRTLLTYSTDNAVKLWSVATGKEMLNL